MAKKPTKPLKIIAHLLDGRIDSKDGIIMLDSIIYHAWYRKHHPEILQGLGQDTFEGYIGLPLRQLSENRWAASRGIYTEIEKNVEYTNKRPNFFNADKIQLLDMDKGIISEGIGLYRAYRIPHIIRTIKDGIITFWAMGHKEEIEQFLQRIPAIGKKYSIGQGLIDYWEVEECEEDRSLWHPEYGLMRPVPVESEEAKTLDLRKYPIMEYGVRPPYWKVKNKRLCYVPIS